MPSLLPLVPSNNQQLECNEGKLGEIEVTRHITGYRDMTRSAGLRGGVGGWQHSGTKLDFVWLFLSL